MRMSSPLFTVSITLMSLAMSPLFAADLTVSDLRLSVGVLSTEYEGASTTTVTDTGNNVTSTTSTDEGRDAEDHGRVQLQYVGGNLGAGGGLIWGIGAAVNHATWNNGAQDAHVTTPTLDVLIGYGYAFTPNWHLELTPFAGYGRAYYSVSDSGSSDTSEEWDHYFEYGAKIGTYFALGGSLVLGIEVPYLVGRFEPDYNYVDDADGQVTVSDKRSNEGFGLLLTIGGRF